MADSDLFLHQNSLRYFIRREPYFIFANSSFWMQDDFAKMWNIAGVNTNKKKGENAHFLTNNALERYNHHFNGIIPSSHPNLVVFAHALRGEEAKSVSQRLEDVRKGREKAPTYSTSFIEIPKEFYSFKWSPVASKKRKAAKKLWCDSSGGMVVICGVVGVLLGFCLESQVGRCGYGHVCYLLCGWCFGGLFCRILSGG